MRPSAPKALKATSAALGFQAIPIFAWFCIVCSDNLSNSCPQFVHILIFDQVDNIIHNKLKKNTSLQVQNYFARDENEEIF